MLVYMFPNDDNVNTVQLYGVIGVVLVTIGIPTTAVWLSAEFGTLQGLTWITGTVMVVKGLIANVLGNVLWTKAVFLLGPTVVTIAGHVSVRGWRGGWVERWVGDYR